MDKPLLKSYETSQSRGTVDCPATSKPAMANRLLDWFSVVMADSKHRRQHPKPRGMTLHVKLLKKNLAKNLETDLYEYAVDKICNCSR